MTYNFDPEEWLRRNRAVLELRRQRGEVDDAAFEAGVLELDRRYEEMVTRLDGTFEIPSGRDSSGGSG